MLDLSLSAFPLCCRDVPPLDFGRNDSSGLYLDRTGVQRQPQSLLDNLRRNVLGSNDSGHDACDGLVAAELQRELARSSYRLADVRSEVDSSTIHLFGIVKSYYALQMAIQIACKLAAGRRIELGVDVVLGLYEDDGEEARTSQADRPSLRAEMPSPI